MSNGSTLDLAFGAFSSDGLFCLVSWCNVSGFQVRIDGFCIVLKIGLTL